MSNLSPSQHQAHYQPLYDNMTVAVDTRTFDSVEEAFMWACRSLKLKAENHLKAAGQGEPRICAPEDMAREGRRLYDLGFINKCAEAALVKAQRTLSTHTLSYFEQVAFDKVMVILERRLINLGWI